MSDKELETAFNWLKSVPDQDHAVSAMFLALLNARKAFSAETCIKNDEAEALCDHFSDALMTIRLFGMICNGDLVAYWNKEIGDAEFTATEQGRKRAKTVRRGRRRMAKPLDAAAEPG